MKERNHLRALDYLVVLLIGIAALLVIWIWVDREPAPKPPYVQDGVLILANVQQEWFTCTPVGAMYRGKYAGWPCKIEYILYP